MRLNEMQNLTIVNHHNKNSSKHLQVLCTRLAALKIIKPPKNHPISQSSDLSFAPDCKVACRSSGVWIASWLCQLELAKWCKHGKTWQNMLKPCWNMVFHHGETINSPQLNSQSEPRVSSNTCCEDFHTCPSAELQAQAMWMCQWDPCVNGTPENSTFLAVLR